MPGFAGRTVPFDGRLRLTTLLAALVCALALGLALASGAQAVAHTFSVNTTADTPDANVGDDLCDADPAAGPNVCTLRAAIEEINAEADENVSHLIGFPSHLFNGEAADKIVLGSPLPTLRYRAHFDSPTCGTVEAPKPCTEVGYAALTPSPVISIDGAAGVLINGMAITNGSVGILVEANTAGDHSNDFGLQRSWVGLHLDGTPGGNQIGVLLRGDRVDNAVIGGALAFERNVISHNTVTGIDVENADVGEILGNYIGTKPDGVTQAGNGAGLITGENIEISSGSAGFEIGARTSATAVASEACDGGCNVIADAGADHQDGNRPQIDLAGDTTQSETPSQNTTVRGNYIGMGADGESFDGLGNAGIGISIRDADGVAIGGVDPGDRNRINGSSFGTSNNGGAENLVIQGNWFNLAFNGMELAGARSNAIGISANGSVGINNVKPYIDANRVAVPHGNNNSGITLAGGSGIITNNVIGNGTPESGEIFPGGAFGIRVVGTDQSNGATIVDDNIIHRVRYLGSPEQAAGILLRGAKGVEVTSNSIGQGGDPGSTGDGIRLEPNGATDASSNLIGWEGFETQNSIHSDRDAISIPAATPSEAHAQENTIAENRGSAGSGFLFIDIGSDGLGNGTPTQGALEAPVVQVAGADFARGTANPGAVIRVVGTSGPPSDPSAPQNAFGWLGKTTADSNGNWRLDYAEDAAVVEGARVSATQTDGLGNTSELSEGVPTDGTAPAAPAIAGPSGPTNDPTPAFTLTPSEPVGGGTLVCWIDQDAPADCGAGTFEPATPLSEGPHVFHARHTDAAGNASEATREFAVDTASPGPPAITTAPPSVTRDRTPTFTQSGESGSTFSCTLNGAQLPCAAGPLTLGPLSDGTYEFAVTQSDPAGNQSPATARTFRIDTRAPQTRIVKGPRVVVVTSGPRGRATFRFRASERPASFQCKLDRRPWRRCAKRRTFGLTIGRHIVRVRAADAAGNRDRTPARRVVTVLSARG